MKRNAWWRAATAGLTLAASLAGAAGPADAAATPITVLNGQFPYSGQGSQTQTFIESVFEANIPDILAGAGKIKIGFSIESTTTAEVHAFSTHRVTAEGDLDPGQPLTVRTSQDSFDIVALPELVLSTRPVLRVVFDYEPDDTDAFECSPFQLTGVEPVATGDGDATCGRFEITVPEPAGLLDAQFTPPYAGGSVAVQDEREVFTIPVCARLAGRLGIGPLEDICGIRLEALVAARLSAGPTGGFRATTSLATDQVLPGGAIDRGGLRVSDPEVVRWPSPDPVTQSLTLPCQPEGSPLYYRLDNNVYGSQVDQVTVQAQIDFVLAGATVKQIAVGAPFDLLGEGNTIAVTATHNSLVPQIGTVSADERGPLVSPGGPYRGVEGSSIQLTAVGAGPNGSLGECDPAAVTYEWSFDDGTTATGVTVQKTFADNLPSPHQATLAATDRLGNSTAVPFTIDVANVAPVAAITSPTTRPIVAIGSFVDFVATATDPGSQDVLTRL